MRASTDQVRDLTHDVVDGARRRASGAVVHGADRVVTTLDGAASTIGDGVDRLTERAPTLSLAARPRSDATGCGPCSSPSVVLVVIVAAARKLLGDEPRGHRRPGARRRRPPASSNGDGSKTAESDDAEPLEDANVGDG